MSWRKHEGWEEICLANGFVRMNIRRLPLEGQRVMTGFADSAFMI
jgi:hypothetical protein